jgi:hypothetical protein
MNRRLLLLGLLAAPATARAQGDDGWETVVAPDLHCRLEMPKPVTKSTAAKKEEGNASLRLAWESRRADQIFDFDYVDYEPGWFTGHDSKAMAKALGRGDAEKAFPRTRFKYVRDEPATLQGWDGYALDIEGEDGDMVMMRTYIVKDRLYRLLATARGDMRTRSAATRFIESLRLAETRP